MTSDGSQWQRLSSWLATQPLPQTEEHPCPYLPDRTARERAFVAESLEPETYHELMDRGFRRNGRMFYAADCAACRRCVPIRVPVAEFAPSRSQRRVLRKNRDMVTHFGEPQWSPKKWERYCRYLREQHGRDDVDETPESFRQSLYARVVDTIEVTYWIGERTVATSLLDVCSRSVSAVYHFFDPDFADRSPGVYSVLAEIEWTRRLGVPHYYLGYWIEGAPTMEYKANYRPHELLIDGTWQRR